MTAGRFDSEPPPPGGSPRGPAPVAPAADPGSALAGPSTADPLADTAGAAPAPPAAPASRHRRCRPALRPTPRLRPAPARGAVSLPRRPPSGGRPPTGGTRTAPKPRRCWTSTSVTGSPRGCTTRSAASSTGRAVRWRRRTTSSRRPPACSRTRSHSGAVHCANPGGARPHPPRDTEGTATRAAPVQGGDGAAAEGVTRTVPVRSAGSRAGRSIFWLGLVVCTR